MRRGRPKPSEIVARLVEIGTERLMADMGIDTDSAHAVVREIAHRWCSEFGGGHVYLPKDIDFPLTIRDSKLWRDFTGHNTWELAAKYSLTERQVRYICELMRKQSVRLNQLELPGLDEPD